MEKAIKVMICAVCFVFLFTGCGDVDENTAKEDLTKYMEQVISDNGGLNTSGAISKYEIGEMVSKEKSDGTVYIDFEVTTERQGGTDNDNSKQYLKGTVKTEEVYSLNYTKESGSEWALQDIYVVDTSSVPLTGIDGQEAIYAMQEENGSPGVMRAELLNQKTDLDLQEDVLTYRIVETTTNYTREGERQYTYCFNDGSRMWESVETEDIADWEYTYSLSDNWLFKKEKNDGTVVAAIKILEHKENQGELVIELNSGFIDKRGFQYKEMPVKLVCKVSVDNPLVFVCTKNSRKLEIGGGTITWDGLTFNRL